MFLYFLLVPMVIVHGSSQYATCNPWYETKVQISSDTLPKKFLHIVDGKTFLRNETSEPLYVNSGPQRLRIVSGVLYREGFGKFEEMTTTFFKEGRRIGEENMSGIELTSVGSFHLLMPRDQHQKWNPRFDNSWFGVGRPQNIKAHPPFEFNFEVEYLGTKHLVKVVHLSLPNPNYDPKLSRDHCVKKK